MKNKKILLYGIGSLQNRGCEALVNSSISQFDKKTNIVAATFDYEYDKNMYKDRIEKFVDHHKHDENKFTEEDQLKYRELQSKPWNTYNYECFYERDVIDEMKDADLCIHIGGDNYCYGVNEWMYAITRKAKELGKKNILWGASLFDEIKDLELIEDLKRYDLLILRERISYNAISKYIDKDRLMVMPDPAFSLTPKKINLNPWYKKQKKIIGLNLSPLTIKNADNEKSIYELIDYILTNKEYSILLIPHVTVEESNDLIILKKIKERYIDNDRIYLEESNLDCQEIKYVIGNCDIVVAARTHASIAAYSQEIPTLVIGYSVKSKGIALELFDEYEKYVIDFTSLVGPTLKNKFKYIENNHEEIRKKLHKKMINIRKESKLIYNNMINRLEDIEKKYVCHNSKCTACMACFNICPVDAIEINENKEGFKYPIINLNKCIQCKKCKKVCPAINSQINKNEILECYGAKAIDNNILQKSSSGGIFTYLASEVLKNKGVVYGATIEKTHVSHLRISAKEELYKINGSKYSQSDINKIYQNVKNDLESKKEVVFSGTPCQIVGLYRFLGKKYQNLTLISVICHGVINEKLLKKRIVEFERQYDTEDTSVKYRTKKNGWDPAEIEYQSSKVNKTFNFSEDPLMNIFVKNYALRESCYNCPSKGIDKNPADIILGDFWGIYQLNQEFYDKKGVSSVIIKTKKGKRLFNKIKDNISIFKTNIEDISKYNSLLSNSAEKPLYRNKIFNDLDNNSLEIISEICNYKEDEYIKEQVKQLQAELNEIYSSKKYKLVCKITNIISKLKNRER